jgi:hypothetical protein
MNELLTELAPSLQRLVDARLDNIDRALLSTDTSRYERRQIVSAVEDQIQELVARIDKAEPSREDILRILASLDPPEAYGSGSMQATAEQPRLREPSPFSAIRMSTSTSFEPKANTLSIVSVVLAAASLMAIPGVFIIDIVALLLSAIVSMSALICGIVSLCQLWNAKGKEYGHWMSILGIVSFPVGLMTMLLFYIALEGS